MQRPVRNLHLFRQLVWVIKTRRDQNNAALAGRGGHSLHGALKGGKGNLGFMAYKVQLANYGQLCQPLRGGHLSGITVKCAIQSVLGDDSQRLRSEERRVGKECRSRWSPYH